jgi:DNA-binding NarL/FixJ family response regulator
MAKKKTAPPAPEQTRIYIVDDHPIFRQGLAGLIGQAQGMMICGQADNAATAFDEIPRVKPHIVLTDIGLPGKSGLELVRDLHAVQPGLPVLVLSMHEENLYAERVLRAGGRGYIMKQEGPEKILQAIARILDGEIYLSKAMSSGFLEQIARPNSRHGTSPIGKLTDREFEVFRLIGQGKDSHQIAADLHLSSKTVDTHRANIRHKLKLKSGIALSHFATQWVTPQ